MVKIYAAPYVRLGMVLEEVKTKLISPNNIDAPVGAADHRYLLSQLGEGATACQKLQMSVSHKLFTRTNLRFRHKRPTYRQAQADFVGRRQSEISTAI